MPCVVWAVILTMEPPRSAIEARRTALATLLVRRPELWLLDEPHAALDQQRRDTVDRLITDAAAAGATVLVASHELERVAGVTRRTVTIAGGLVVGDTGATGHEGSAP